MKKMLWLFPILLSLSMTCMAQDHPAWEIFGGYSYLNSDVREYYKSAPTIYASRSTSAGLHGWKASVSENTGHWFGGTLEVGGNYRSATVLGTENRERTYSVLFGPRVFKRFSWGTPFAHMLLGAAHANAMVNPVGPSLSAWSFAVAVGGGVDLNLGKKAAVRLFEADYYRADCLGDSQNGFRASAGVLWYLGRTK